MTHELSNHFIANNQEKEQKTDLSFLCGLVVRPEGEVVVLVALTQVHPLQKIIVRGQNIILE